MTACTNCHDSCFLACVGPHDSCLAFGPHQRDNLVWLGVPSAPALSAALLRVLLLPLLRALWLLCACTTATAAPALAFACEAKGAEEGLDCRESLHRSQQA